MDIGNEQKKKKSLLQIIVTEKTKEHLEGSWRACSVGGESIFGISYQCGEAGEKNS